MNTIKCPVEALLSTVFQKWSAYIMHILSIHGELRFGELKRQIPNISQKVLTSKLRELERATFINRSYKATVPPEVSYSLTEQGNMLIPVMQNISDIAHKLRKEEII